MGHPNADSLELGVHGVAEELEAVRAAVVACARLDGVEVNADAQRSNSSCLAHPSIPWSLSGVDSTPCMPRLVQRLDQARRTPRVGATASRVRPGHRREPTSSWHVVDGHNFVRRMKHTERQKTASNSKGYHIEPNRLQQRIEEAVSSRSSRYIKRTERTLAKLPNILRSGEGISIGFFPLEQTLDCKVG